MVSTYETGTVTLPEPNRSTCVSPQTGFQIRNTDQWRINLRFGVVVGELSVYIKFRATLKEILIDGEPLVFLSRSVELYCGVPATQRSSADKNAKMLLMP